MVKLKYLKEIRWFEIIKTNITRQPIAKKAPGKNWIPKAKNRTKSFVFEVNFIKFFLLPWCKWKIISFVINDAAMLRLLTVDVISVKLINLLQMGNLEYNIRIINRCLISFKLPYIMRYSEFRPFYTFYSSINT